MIAYFLLTYAFSWALWIPIQPLVLDGHVALLPLISLGIFGPALVAIALSAIINPRPREGNRNRATITFIVVWIISALIIVSYYVISEQIDITPLLVIISGVTALLPAFVVSSFFSSIPGIKNLLATYRPRGAPGYYLLALVLFPMIWLLGILVSRALGMEVPVSNYFTLDIKLIMIIPLFFLMNCIHGGLSEEPGWRGFALPRLQARSSPLVASLILGVFWAVWHAPARFGGIEAKSLIDTLIEWVLILFVTVIFTWFYNRTEGSILAPALLHASMNITGVFLPGSLGALILILACMVFFIFLDRMWQRLPSENPAIISPLKPSSKSSNSSDTI
ncbi:MAG: CPBP family intramembrane glutamic endopeptidase [Promethearchaeota archaeon]